MESAPFSQDGLDPDQLEKERTLVLKSIDSVQEAIKEIDFDLIKEILHDFYTRLGEMNDENGELLTEIDADAIHVIYTKELASLELENVYGKTIQNNDNQPAMYVGGGIITVLVRECVNDQGEVAPNEKLYLTKIIIHEMLHVQTELLVKDDVTGEVRSHAGVAYISDEKKDGDVTNQEGSPFTLLNEGLTELIADAVFSEYFARSGSVSEYEEKKKWYQKESLIDRGAAYLDERVAVVLLVSKISEYSGVPEDKVYQSLLAEYLAAGDLCRSELLDECKDAPEVQELLLQLKQNDAAIFSKYNHTDIDPILDLWNKSCLTHVKAMTGRDYVGETNKKRILRQKWYQVKH